MGARKKKLNIVSGSGPDPEVNFDASDWQSLEEALSEQISPDAKSQLIALCNGVLMDLEACENACALSDVTEALARYQPMAEAIKTCILHSSETDAEVVADHLFFSELLKQDVLFLQYPIVDFDGEAVEYDLGPKRPIGFRISKQTLMAIYNAIDSALTAAARDVEERESGDTVFDSSKTFGRFCSRVMLWAKHNKLPHRAYSSETRAGRVPSKFAIFLFELHKVLSKQAGNVPAVNSATAFEKWIKRNPVNPTDRGFQNSLNMS